MATIHQRYGRTDGRTDGRATDDANAALVHDKIPLSAQCKTDMH